MKTRQYWTVADVLAEQPCLSEDIIHQHFGTRTRLTLRQILDLPNLSDEHKIWMACRQRALSPRTLFTWRETVLTRIITTYALPHPTSKRWAERWLDGSDRTPEAAKKAAEAAEAASVAGAAWTAVEYATQVAELKSILDA